MALLHVYADVLRGMPYRVRGTSVINLGLRLEAHVQSKWARTIECVNGWPKQLHTLKLQHGFKAKSMAVARCLEHYNTPAARPSSQHGSGIDNDELITTLFGHR